MISKVLIQWAVSPELRHTRMLAMGPHGAGRVAQVAIERGHPLFPSFYALAAVNEGWYAGYPQIQVGFSGHARHNGVCWELDKTMPVTHACVEDPTLEDLYEVAVEQYGPPEHTLVSTTAEAVEAYQGEQKRMNDDALMNYRERVSRAEGAGIQTVPVDGVEDERPPPLKARVVTSPSPWPYVVAVIVIVATFSAALL